MRQHECSCGFVFGSRSVPGLCPHRDDGKEHKSVEVVYHRQPQGAVDDVAYRASCRQYFLVVRCRHGWFKCKGERYRQG